MFSILNLLIINSIFLGSWFEFLMLLLISPSPSPPIRCDSPSLAMGLVTALLGALGFGIGIAIGLVVGYFFYIYFQPNDVKARAIPCFRHSSFLLAATIVRSEVLCQWYLVSFPGRGVGGVCFSMDSDGWDWRFLDICTGEFVDFKSSLVGRIS